MIIGIPKEIKIGENRVGATPAGVNKLVKANHTIFVEKGAGEGNDFKDEEYQVAGATLFSASAEIWKAEMILKVKEPEISEYELLKESKLLFTYLHLASLIAVIIFTRNEITDLLTFNKKYRKVWIYLIIATIPAAIVAPMSRSANLPISGKSENDSIGVGLTGLIRTIAESPTLRNFGFSSSTAPVAGLIFDSNATIVAATCAV